MDRGSVFSGHPFENEIPLTINHGRNVSTISGNAKITAKKLPSIVNQQRVVYQFKCSFCDENYIGFTMRHLHERCAEHKFNS